MPYMTVSKARTKGYSPGDFTVEELLIFLPGDGSPVKLWESCGHRRTGAEIFCTVSMRAASGKIMCGYEDKYGWCTTLVHPAGGGRIVRILTRQPHEGESS